MWGVYHNTPVGRQQFGSATLVFVDGHLRLRAPYPVRSAKLSNIGMGTGRSADRYPLGTNLRDRREPDTIVYWFTNPR